MIPSSVNQIDIYLLLGLQMMWVSSCTVLIQAPLLVEARTARAAEWCWYQEVGAAKLDLEILSLDEQKSQVTS